jgi:hypothetical protein
MKIGKKYFCVFKYLYLKCLSLVLSNESVHLSSPITKKSAKIFVGSGFLVFLPPSQNCCESLKTSDNFAWMPDVTKLLSATACAKFGPWRVPSGWCAAPSACAWRSQCSPRSPLSTSQHWEVTRNFLTCVIQPSYI